MHEFSRLQKILINDVEQAQTCESKEWEIPTATIKTIEEKLTTMDSSPSSSGTETTTKLHTTSRIRTSTTIYPISHKSLTKDNQLKYKSQKITARQVTVSQVKYNYAYYIFYKSDSSQNIHR